MNPAVPETFDPNHGSLSQLSEGLPSKTGSYLDMKCLLTNIKRWKKYLVQSEEIWMTIHKKDFKNLKTLITDRQ